MCRRAGRGALAVLLALLVLAPPLGRAASGTPADSARAELLRALLASAEDSTRHADSTAAGVDTTGGVPLPDARAELHDILRDRDFAPETRESALDRWEREASRWLGRQLERLFGPAARHEGVGEIFGWTMLALTVTALLAVLAYALRDAFGRAHESADGPARVREPGSTVWLERARRAAARGAFREAVHDAYWAAAHRLDEAKAAPFDRARTHRETLRRVPRGHVLRAPFEQVATRYERVWFGRETADENAWIDTAHQLEELGCSDRSSAATASS